MMMMMMMMMTSTSMGMEVKISNIKNGNQNGNCCTETGKMGINISSIAYTCCDIVEVESTTETTAIMMGN